MALVRAKMSFYHDAVGTRAANELFQLTNESVCSELEKGGYIQKVEGQEAQAYLDRINEQSQVGAVNAKANEAVSMAHHVQNVQANEHTQEVTQIRQQRMNSEHFQAQRTAKKADK